MSKTAKNLIIVLGLITVAFGAYFMFMQSSATTLVFDDANDDLIVDMQAKSQLFIERRRRLEETELDTAFFSDDRFSSFQSYDLPVTEQPVGRDNPFRTKVFLATDTN